MSVTLVGDRDVAAALRSPQGLGLRFGPFVARIRSPLPDVAAAVARLYARHPLAGDDEYFHFDATVRRPRGLRRWWQPQVIFEFAGDDTFNPLPGDQGFPLLEWGLNWCVYTHGHQYLVLHAAVLERGGRALVMPAPSGSGKSTLCAALAFSGWRLLSDELALIDPADGRVWPIPRPVSLKNESIAVLQRFAPQAELGSRVDDTVKGTVAHFAPPADAVARADEPARITWVVLPRYAAGQPASLEPMDRAEGLIHLVENAFNFPVYGAEGFRLLGTVLDDARCFSFEYASLAEAVPLFDRLAAAR